MTWIVSLTYAALWSIEPRRYPCFTHFKDALMKRSCFAIIEYC